MVRCLQVEAQRLRVEAQRLRKEALCLQEEAQRLRKVVVSTAEGCTGPEQYDAIQKDLECQNQECVTLAPLETGHRQTHPHVWESMQVDLIQVEPIARARSPVACSLQTRAGQRAGWRQQHWPYQVAGQVAAGSPVEPEEVPKQAFGDLV